MAIRVALNHQTQYCYDRLVKLSPHILRLRPAPHTRTPVQAYSLKIRPAKHFINWQQDPFGNYLARLVFPERTRELYIEVELVAEMTVINPFDFFVEDYAEHYPFRYEPQLAQELLPYLEVKESGPRLLEWLGSVNRSPQNINDFLVALNQRLQQHIGYVIRMEPGIQSCEETLAKRTGSCRDTGWLLVQILRHLGLAARFVSGYLIQLTADVKALDGPSGPEADFTDLHAWAEVYVPGAGWLGLDPTSGLFAGEGHIPLACTPDPASAAPVTGLTDECEVEFHFKNAVQRIHEDPRVTKPYTEAQWDAIDALGRAVDRELRAGDVRLTMGGEPTFVSIDDMDGAEWNTLALGPHKRRLAGTLLKRLKHRFAPGGVLHYGQGKWYPGEPLPRWAFGCFWRQDGTPIWCDPALLADENRDDGYGPDEAERFMRVLAQHLGLDPALALPGYEDTWYYLWKEGKVPPNIDPLHYDLKDPEERRRLARLLQYGLHRPMGYVLPLAWQDDNAGGRWRSSRWELRAEHLFLTPGDSPMGYRLPLDTLPWIAPEEQDILPERCQFEPRPPLAADIVGEVARRYSLQTEAAVDLGTAAPATSSQVPPLKRQGSGAREVVRTALCIEPREGRLHIFLPPLSHLEHYLDLVASIESTAAALNMPVLLEGYQPPDDWRLLRLYITPDPGVIEVNIHPAHTWEELVTRTTVLYEEAHLSRLSTEKFMLDGRHTGTGGGNHVTLGGPTPADSPLLRRPDLLQSLITYWQHHPSLSYLFSGLFIGPTSQAPRVDEARNDSLYELEIAFQQIPLPADEVPQPWLVDRLLRNLLVDVTGNTHRAEFCIDKLYSPEGPAGRLGLVEMRAFEMPPHAHMSLMQMLLLRALIARFWNTPYTHKLVPWGTELHDRFMLPHFVWEDFKDVICELQRAGYPFEIEWFAPFFEFRFPLYGTVQVGTMELELRLAIEPWHVLGEEMTSFGTARFVDSSVERLQAKLRGMTDSRHVLACNGRRVPLRPTANNGEFVAGIRYRAWQPPSALHPTIPAHSPLVFDVIDSWNGRAIGGCTYHVAHPGGRHYEVFPVNANEAEARRHARFWLFGYTPQPLQPPPDLRHRQGRFLPQGSGIGPAQPPLEEPSGRFPYTLDLRWQDGC
jgi:uncharacterized protein (DUF2126 family)